MSGINTALAAAAGTTGNNTHASIGLPQNPCRLAFSIVAEVVGATPTVTWKYQVSTDPLSVSDANSTWVDLIYFTPGTNDTPAVATRAFAPAAAPASDTVFLDDANGTRFFRKARLVTTANTNVTYRGEVLEQYRN